MVSLTTSEDPFGKYEWEAIFEKFLSFYDETDLEHTKLVFWNIQRSHNIVPKTKVKTKIFR